MTDPAPPNLDPDLSSLAVVQARIVTSCYDAEINTMALLVDIMERLGPAEQQRAAVYLADRYGPRS